MGYNYKGWIKNLSAGVLSNVIVAGGGDMISIKDLNKSEYEYLKALPHIIKAFSGGKTNDEYTNIMRAFGEVFEDRMICWVLREKL